MADVGIIGAGALGSAVASQLARAGISVVIASRRAPDALEEVAAAIGGATRAGTKAEAAACPMVVLAVRWDQLEELAAELGDLGGRILVDATNPYVLRDGELAQADLGGRTSSAVVAGLFRGARLVKAFNNQYAATIAGPTAVGGGRLAMFLSGDDADARSEVARLLQRVGWAPVILGDLASGAHVQRGRGPLAGLALAVID